MMTEEEAKTKWCPFVRLGVAARTDIPPINRIEDRGEIVRPPATRCFASTCMAFRFLPDAVVDLSGNQVVVDEEDADLLRGAWWDGRYARNDEDRLHRLIARRAFGVIPDGMLVDHINGDARNCRRRNLRVVTKAQNAANATTRGGASKYRGVYLVKRSGKWAAQIAKGGVRMSLGTFNTEEEAAAAYDEAAGKLHGEYARPNLLASGDGRRGYCGLAGKP